VKEKLTIPIIPLLLGAWAAGTTVASYVFYLSNKVLILENDMIYLEKKVNSCVTEDVYQVDKLLILEKCNRSKVNDSEK